MKGSYCFCEKRDRSYVQQEGGTLYLQLLCGCAGGLVGNIGHHNPQDPAVYAKEKDAGYPEPWHKSRLTEELEHVSLLQP